MIHKYFILLYWQIFIVVLSLHYKITFIIKITYVNQACYICIFPFCKYSNLYTIYHFCLSFLHISMILGIFFSQITENYIIC